MWKTLFALLVIGGMLWIFIFYLVPYVKPNFSRQGKIVLINNKDTAIIVQEEPTPPSWAVHKREITVRYKDKIGVYHEESFPENEITEIE